MGRAKGKELRAAWGSGRDWLGNLMQPPCSLGAIAPNGLPLGAGVPAVQLPL